MRHFNILVLEAMEYIPPSPPLKQASIIIYMFNKECLLRTGTKSCRYVFLLIFSLVRQQMMIKSVTLKNERHTLMHDVTV